MYEYHQRKISIPAHLLYEEWNLITYSQYEKWSKPSVRKLTKTQKGGYGRRPFISFYDMPPSLQEECIKHLGHPADSMAANILTRHITSNLEAADFYAAHRKPNGKPLSDLKRLEKTTNCEILDSIHRLLNERGLIGKMFGKQKTNQWRAISKTLNHLSIQQYPHKLPGNYRRLAAKYKEYQKDSFKTFIHGGEGTDNASKIKDDIADYILAQYSSPLKPKTPQVLERYNMRRIATGWPSLTEQAIYNWLHAESERIRVWTLGRQGKSSYDNKFKHTQTRDREEWFPNCYWGIDGTKLDWVHYKENPQKMGADLKIDVVFDIYSEKIIGHSLSFTENHTDHFNSIKMAVNESKSRPYYLTYDNQSGHKMQRMQDLYSSLVAEEGGTHHPHRSRRHNSPVEQLFNRFQQQTINRFWWSDGQGVTVTNEDNKANFDFIAENKHLLKSTEELKEAFEYAVAMWNESKHPHLEMTRNAAYIQPMPMREELSIYDIMDKMWLVETKPIKYKAHGLDMMVADKKYQYEVYDKDGNIDLEFRRTSVGKKFIVRYAPDFLDGYVSLCEKDDYGEIIEVATAEPKRKHQVVPVLMKPGQKEQWSKDEAIKEMEYKRDKAALEALRERTGITPEKEIENQEFNIKHKEHLDKDSRSEVESVENAFLRL